MMPPTQQTTNPSAPQAPAPGAFDVVEGGGATPRLRLRARDGAAVVELGVIARADRRLLVAVHAAAPTSASRPTSPPRSRTRPPAP